MEIPMSWVYEIALRGDAAAASAWFEAGPRAALKQLPALACADVYTPAQGSIKDPYNHETSYPSLLLVLDFTSQEALAEAVKSGAIAKAIGALPDNTQATGAAFERFFYPVGTGTTPAPLDAPFSYVVRYHRPAEDEKAFIDNYLATHPITQAAMPDIRAIMCYLPIDALNGGQGTHDGALAPANYMIGNEVVFDDLAAFNGAMLSPVREELRAHFREFPPFSGANTHYPMARERFVG
jgi:hypothetical protein